MNRSKVDFWAFRSKQNLGAIEGALGHVFADAPGRPRLIHRKTGWKGYEACADVLLDEMSVGLVAYGGQSQRGWAYTSLSGRGCEWVSDWDRAQEAADRLDGYSLKRVDIALDRFDPDGFDKCLAAYRAGAFAPAGQGGRPPKCTTIRGELEEDGSTINVGSRQRDKYFRGYEKGKQLFSREIAASISEAKGAFRMRIAGEDGHDQLVPVADWFRYELELKPKTAPLPEDVIDRRDQYFAGAYPYLSTVLADVDAQPLVMRREKGPQIDLAAALSNIQRTYGNTLFTALVAHHGDIGAVWEKVCGKKHSEHLVRAGVLMVDHD